MQATVRKSFARASALAFGLLGTFAFQSSAHAVPPPPTPSQGHFYRICHATPSGNSCQATACGSWQAASCAANGSSCSCNWGSYDWDGTKSCQADEHVECSDRGNGLGCYCARGLAPLLPQQPLAAYPLEIAITDSPTTATTFVRFDNGTVWGWGAAGAMLAGGGDSGIVSTPQQITFSGKVTKITAGFAGMCALLQDTTVQCLGDVGGTNWTSPVTINSDAGVPLTGMIGLSQSTDHACAWGADGHVACWGKGTYSRFGDAGCNSYDDTTGAFTVTAVTDAAQVVTSDANTCFLRKNGHVACVGVSQSGQLGTGQVDTPGTTGANCYRSKPVSSVRGACLGTSVATDVPGLSNVLNLSGGASGSFCAETKGGTFCWGANDYYRLWLPIVPGTSECLAPSIVPVKRPEGPYHVFGANNTCVWSPRGIAQCWGAHGQGVLLDGSFTPDKPTPPQVLPFAQDITSLDIGSSHACYAGQGVIRCWGEGSSGQLGNGNTMPSYNTMVSVEGFGAPVLPPPPPSPPHHGGGK